MSVDQPLSRIGRHEIVRLLGRGGMGSVYLARDPVIDRPVAIKLISQGFDDPRARERLAREARAAGQLQHPNIVTVFDVGEHDDQLFIAMEYVRGESLAALLRKQTPMSLAARLGLIEEACSALGYAHRAGIIHLDIKPDNLMVDDEGRLKILDFGIARVSGDDSTRTAGSGTLRYMAPEQLTGGPLDSRCDVFALGCVLYEIVSLVPAFDGSVKDVVARVLSGDPVPLEAVVPDVDRDLSRLVARMLAREPLRRPDLAQVGHQLAEIRLRLAEGEPAAGRAGTDTGRSAGSRRWSWAAGVLALGLAAVSAVLWRESNGPALPARDGEARSPSADTTPARNAADPAVTAAGAADSGAVAGRKQPARDDRPVATDDRDSRSGRQAARRANPSAATPALPASPEPEAPRTTSPPVAEPPPVETKPPVPPEPAASPPAAPTGTERAAVRPTNVPSHPPASMLTTTEEAAIAATLQRYETAYESLNVALIRDVYPTLTQEQIERLTRDFARLNSYRVDLADVKVSITGDTAIVACTIIRQIAPRVGRPEATTTPTRIRLRKQAERWVIEGLGVR